MEPAPNNLYCIGLKLDLYTCIVDCHQTWVRSCFGFGFGFTKPKLLRLKLRLRLQLRDLKKSKLRLRLQLRDSAKASASASASRSQKVKASVWLRGLRKQKFLFHAHHGLKKATHDVTDYSETRNSVL